MSAAKAHLRAGRKAMLAGKPAQAIAHFARALAQEPRNLGVVRELAHAFRADGQPLNALKAFNRIIAEGGADAATWRSAGETLLDVKESAQALDAFARSLELEADHADTHHGLALAAYNLGEVDRAADHLAEAARLKPRRESILSRAALLPGAPGASHREVLEARRALADDLAAKSPLAGRPRPGPYGHAKPRIGYLSSHFRNENYMKPVWALLNHHARERFELHLFSDAVVGAGEFAGYAAEERDRIHEVGALDNQRLAQLIAREQIDLLVDLNSYSSPDRLELFLSPVAPVVAAWFNSFATSGLPGIDMIIGDDETVTPDEEQFYSERVARLPLSYLTFNVTHDAPPVAEPPCLANGFVTFGSLVTQYKITPPVIEAWSAILREAPGSRLVLSNRALESVENAAWLKARFAERGVDTERLSILPPAPHREFLGYYGRIDLALDSFPYNGGTTTMEAIWQGVPVLTFNGDRWASRTSQTILRRTHLGAFVSDDVDAMIAQAVLLGNGTETPGVLARLRSSMREKLAASPACDGAALAAAMESLSLELLGQT